MNQDLTKKTDPSASSHQKPASLFDWKRNVVDDPTAPQLYSERAVWAFSFLMAPLFGSVLMTMNLNQIRKTKGMLTLLAFGILWYAFVVFVLPREHSTPTVYLLNMIGGAILLYFFWPKFIGRDLKYRTKPIWMPLIIAVLIATFFILQEFYPWNSVWSSLTGR